MREMRYRDWHRYAHAEFMGRQALPFIQAGATLEVSRLRQLARDQGISFYLSLIWALTRVMEAREDFRWRKRGDVVVLPDRLEPSFTDMMAGTELYKIVHAGFVGEDMAAYARHARQVADAQAYYFPSDEEEKRDDYIFFSSTPGYALTSLIQPVGFDADHFIPGVAWSRYAPDGERLLLPVTVLCNHRQVDGLHVTRLFAEAQGYLDSL